MVKASAVVTTTKKAYVTLKAGQDVQMADAGEEVANTTDSTSETANNE
ncbi:LSU ribosomal protein L23p [Psychrobacter sp. JCM 18900]|nr:LSU ribosomal protein L23p [Psychrobacter sp. JCM 18900]